MLLAFVFSSAQAWQVLETEDGQPLAFQKFPIVWEFEPANAPDDLPADQQYNAIRRSISPWQFIEGTSLDIQEGGSNPNRVFWEADWPFDPEKLAVTSTWANERGEIIGFDIRINAAYGHWGFGSDGHMDLQNTMTHELGHALGLDHEMELDEATMFPTTVQGETSKRDLAADDRYAIQYLYQQSSEGHLFGCNAAGTGLFSLFPTLSVFFLRRRKSQ